MQCCVSHGATACASRCSATPAGASARCWAAPTASRPRRGITYVIDAQGIVRAIIGVPRIAADEHPQAALDSLALLQGS